MAASTAPASSALGLARTPRGLRRAAAGVGLLFLLLVPVLLLCPWTQTVHGTGRAVAFNPVLRPQVIVSPIQGRVLKWHAVEGDKVRAGQKLVDLVDNDPLRLERLRDQLLFADQRRTFAAESVADQRGRLTNVEAERPLLLEQARARVDAAEAGLLQQEQQIVRENANVLREGQNYNRLKRLHDQKGFEKGDLVSTTDLEEAERRFATAQNSVEVLRKGLVVLEKQADAARASQRAEAERTAGLVASDRQAVNAREADLRAADQSVLAARTEVERQENQFVAAPVAGTVFRVLANAEAGGQLVSPGQQLAVLVPDLRPGDKPALRPAPGVGAAGGGAAGHAAGGLTPRDYPGICAELTIDGNDLPLVRPGDRVLVQFEGWAAVQFASYPEAAVGTFEGRVYLVDPTSDGQGRFRILVEPAPGQRPWPDEEYLRQGVRAQGWVLAKTVSVGYEVWRLLNGFPPAREVKPKGKPAPFGPVADKPGK